MAKLFILVPPGANGEHQVIAQGFVGGACRTKTKSVLDVIGGQTASDTPVPDEQEAEMIDSNSGCPE